MKPESDGAGKLGRALRAIRRECRRKPHSTDWKRFELLLLAICGQLALIAIVLTTKRGTDEFGEAQWTFSLGSIATALIVALTLRARIAETLKSAARAFGNALPEFTDIVAATSVGGAILLLGSVALLLEVDTIPRGVRVPAVVGVAVYWVIRGLRSRRGRGALWDP